MTEHTPRQRKAAAARKAVATRRRRSDPLVIAENRAQIVQGFVAGFTVEEIAQATGMSVQLVWKERRNIIETRTAERDKNIAELREAELLRLDRLQRAHWANALQGHLGSSQIVLKCIGMRCDKLGLQAPGQVSETQRSELDAQIEALIDQLTEQGLVKR